MTGNLEDQTKRTMDGIKQTFDAAGASFKDVVPMFVFRAGPQMGDIGRASGVINSYFAPFNHKPTSTNIAVRFNKGGYRDWASRIRARRSCCRRADATALRLRQRITAGDHRQFRRPSGRVRLPHAYPWRSGQVSLVCGAHVYARGGAAGRNDRAAQGAQDPARGDRDAKRVRPRYFRDDLWHGSARQGRTRPSPNR